MASEEEAKVESEGLSGLGRNGEVGGGTGGQIGLDEKPEQMQFGMMGAPTGGFTGRRYGDYRLDAPDEPPANELSLEDYIVTKGSKKNRRGKSAQKDVEPGVDNDGIEEAGETGSTSRSATTLCPVCGEFEGDEVAVAHHVNGHFD